MSNSNPVISQIDHFNENLISNIQGGVIICQFDPLIGASKTIYLSEGWTALTGYTLQELNADFGGNPQALVCPEDSARATRDYMEQTARGNSYQLEYRCRRKDGKLIWVIDRGVITFTAEGYNQNQSIITDITPMKESEEKLRMSEARFRVAISASHATVFEFDIAEQRYVSIENAEVVFCASEQTVITQFDTVRTHTSDFTMEDALLQWYHPNDVPLLLHTYQETLRSSTGACDVRVRQPGGHYIWCKLHQAAVDDGNGNPLRVIGHLVNIEEQHRRTERLLQEAQSDALTGLYNKNAIRELVEHALQTSPHLSQPLFMLDIDNFKGVNDQLGHLFGDAVLMDIASKLKRLFRRDGVVGRIGGDEFVIMMQGDCCAQDAVSRAEQICNVFRHTYSGEKKDYKISCSVGVAFSAAQDSFDTLFHRADLALYRAKSLGKDQYVVYTDDLRHKTFVKTPRINQTDNKDSGGLKIKERIFELLYDSVDFSGSVNMILTLLGQLLETSRIYIFENTPDNQYAQSIYEWHAESVPPIATCGQRLRLETLRSCTQFDKDGVCYVRDVSVLAQPLRAIYEESGARAAFQVAIVAENIIQGFMRYDNPGNGRTLSQEQIDLMVFAAKVTGTFIIKKRADESHKLFNQNKMEALDNLPSAIYVIDESYRLQYVNNGVLAVYPDVKTGQKCHEVFRHYADPCPNCPAARCINGPCSTEIYNPYSGIWMIANATSIRWSGNHHMRLLCCQTINQYKIQQDPSQP